MSKVFFWIPVIISIVFTIAIYYNKTTKVKVTQKIVINNLKK
jgi:hypothetical protein